MARTPTDAGRTDAETGSEFLVVNTADAAREVAISLARGSSDRTEELTLDGGGYTSVAAPRGEAPLTVSTETTHDHAIGVGFARPPMVVVGDRSVDLC